MVSAGLIPLCILLQWYFTCGFGILSERCSRSKLVQKGRVGRTSLLTE
jgi:hypothetical protein